MDPVTLWLQLGNKIADIVLLAMQGQPDTVRIELWNNYMKRADFWQTWADKIAAVVQPEKKPVPPPSPSPQDGPRDIRQGTYVGGS